MVNKLTCGKILLVAELQKDAIEIKKRLTEKCKYKSNYEVNFTMSKNNIICCFDEKRMYITDKNFNPLIAYESTSYINACAISDNAKYMICQMANNNDRDEDSGATALFDIKSKQILAKRMLPTGVNGVRHIFIDEHKQIIYIYIADSILGEGNNLVVKYDFNLQPDEKSLQEYYKKPDISPYVLNSRVNWLIKDVKNGTRNMEQVEKEIVELLKRLKTDINMSTNQLSITFKELGELYSNHDEVAKAIDAYEMGLLLNPKLPVKKNLNKLKKEL